MVGGAHYVYELEFLIRHTRDNRMVLTMWTIVRAIVNWLKEDDYEKDILCIEYKT